MEFLHKTMTSMIIQLIISTRLWPSIGALIVTCRKGHQPKYCAQSADKNLKESALDCLQTIYKISTAVPLVTTSEESCHYEFTCFIVFNYVFMHSVDLGLNLAVCLKMFWNRESDFLLLLLRFYVFIFFCFYFYSSVRLYFNILPPAVCVSLSSSVDRSSYLLHSPSLSFTPFLPPCLSLSLSDPLKWDPIMFFPSCSPPTLRWGGEPPAGGIKDMIYRAPSQTKKKRKKTLNERSVFQHSSPVLHCRFHPSKFWLRNMATKRRCGPFFCQVAKVPNFSSTRDEKAAIKPVSVFSMCVLLTCLDESDREIQMREEVGAVKAQGCGVDTL